MRMHQAGHTLSSRWLGRVFSLSLDRSHSAASSHPPEYLCPALWSGAPESTVVPRRHFTSRPRQFAHGYHYGCSSRVRGLHAHAEAAITSAPEPQTERLDISRQPVKALPLNCTGCGASSQTTVPNQPGYYDMSRNAIKQYLGIATAPKKLVRKDDEVVQQALAGLDLEQMEKLGIDLKSLVPPRPPMESDTKIPLCDRCHQLVYHDSGTPIDHPSLDTLLDTIEASPYKYNHVYHVLDAADFPMSLLPKIRSIVDMMPLRSHNRRAMGGKFYKGRKMELSFIITRSDLLAYSKEKVDSLMPYLRETLRDALGRLGKNVRLGNVRCVSAKRGWWTKELKKEIFQRGGAGWMVGKVNVGKSRLFQEVFPKGEALLAPAKPAITIRPLDAPTREAAAALASPFVPDWKRSDHETSLLPPPQPETQYPIMPIHSPVPGTTALPIRIPFGKGKGELIDLPGLSRGDLSYHVQEDKRASLIMNRRILPEQQALWPSQSLLLGGFIRITPQTPIQFLTYNFTPLTPHVAQTGKCIAISEQSPEAPNVENIALPGTGAKMQSAGSFALKYDVTASRAASMLRAMDGRKRVGDLPFRVLGIDILVEGCGWVEIVAQVRTKDYPHRPPTPSSSSTAASAVAEPKQRAVDRQEPAKNKTTGTTWGKNGLLQTLDLSDPNADAQRRQSEPERRVADGVRESDVQKRAARALAKQQQGVFSSKWASWIDDGYEDVVDEVDENQEAQEDTGVNWPTIEVFSPEGWFIGSRRPMNAWEINKKSDERYVTRQRRSMKGEDKRRKAVQRAAAGH
ncbi:hypothetical protein B0H66DRAFT_564895 [Apodospora peruviana]|uniref:Genetic interactor of prohibitins 3, mitochondrial n=1 Tax=Apodospora peruviana TaxID=516989 RepID=A0AAE0HYN4_9PEZI|nr:hypothetical protein B0H66DRAFT_564895 [Apodospora peruviana]